MASEVKRQALPIAYIWGASSVISAAIAWPDHSMYLGDRHSTVTAQSQQSQGAVTAQSQQSPRHRHGRGTFTGMGTVAAQLQHSSRPVNITVTSHTH